MALSLLIQGLVAIVTAISSLVTHVAVSTDSTAFATSQTVMNPGGGDVLTLAATTTTVGPVEDAVVDKTITINGDTQFTGLVINCIGPASGTGTEGAGTDTLGRIVRAPGLGIGVQTGDVFTVGVRLKIEDNS
jgi:hypothetical protein